MAYRSGFLIAPGGMPGVFSLRREIDRLFEDAFNTQGDSAARGAAQGSSFTPAVDAREAEREITLHVDLPGVRPDDVDISVENGLLTVRGQRHQQRREGQEGRYHFVERSYGSFSRAFHLPQGVDESQIRADFEQGELTIRVPKPAQPQPRKVQIGVGGAPGATRVNAANGSAPNGQSGAPSSGHAAPTSAAPQPSAGDAAAGRTTAASGAPARG